MCILKPASPRASRNMRQGPPGNNTVTDDLTIGEAVWRQHYDGVWDASQIPGAVAFLTGTSRVVGMAAIRTRSWPRMVGFGWDIWVEHSSKDRERTGTGQSRCKTYRVRWDRQGRTWVGVVGDEVGGSMELGYQRPTLGLWGHWNNGDQGGRVLEAWVPDKPWVVVQCSL
jgi:hypothetical protein